VARSAGLVFLGLLGSLVLCGHFYASLTKLNGGLVVAATLLAGLSPVVPMGHLKPWQQSLTRYSLLLLPLAAALAIAVFEFTQSVSARSDYGY
jgi:hypothetical protein